ncbi:MAG: tryptophan--tRNA ligase [Bacillota bacterium]
MKIFSGIQPTNIVHIGNYLGAIKNWVELQNKADETIFCIVDLHAITVSQDPKQLQDNILKMAALYIACGIDTKESTIFVQSSRPEHTELAWILNCHATMGELQRMTQFKEKSEGQSNYSAGLFNYPTLMAADILIYNATHVPVGEDQKQHIELTRDLAEKINKKYGQIFTVPEPIIKKQTARIMALDDPSKKMSKSAPSVYSYISLTDDTDAIREKIKRAVTDSGDEIRADKDKPAITNLLTIFSGFSDRPIEDIEKEYKNKKYSEFKSDLAELLIEKITPIREKYEKLLENPDKLKAILESGSEDLKNEAQATLSKVKSKIGLGIK